jgi:hypothetical protein
MRPRREEHDMADRYYRATGFHADGAFSLGEFTTREAAHAACRRDAEFVPEGWATTYRVRVCWRGFYRDHAEDTIIEFTARGPQGATA